MLLCTYPKKLTAQATFFIHFKCECLIAIKQCKETLTPYLRLNIHKLNLTDKSAHTQLSLFR